MLINATTTQLIRLIREAAPKIVEANLKINIFNLTLWFHHYDEHRLLFTDIDSEECLWDYTDLAEQYKGLVWYIDHRAC